MMYFRRCFGCCCDSKDCCPPCPPFPPVPPVPPTPPIVPTVGDSAYASATGATVDAGAIIPIGLSASSTGSGITFTGNQFMAPAGLYSVSYSVDSGATPSTATLYVGGAPLSTEILTTGTNTGTASKTALIRLTQPSTIGLYNTSTTPITFTDAGLSITRVAN